MDHTLDVSILGYKGSSEVVTLARRGNDIAVASFLGSKTLKSLSDFRTRIERAILGQDARPTPEELLDFGRDLFLFTIPDQLRDLYARLPVSPAHVRMNVLTNRPDLQTLPWEYLQEPKQPAGPRRERSVVRIVPTVGVEPPAPKKMKDKVRVMFVAADPKDQEALSWPDVRDSIKRTFDAQIPDQFEIDVVPGASTSVFTTKTAREDFDIVHFSGHGKVIDGVGNLAFKDPKTKTTTYIPADRLAKILGGRGIRLIVLSACETASGNYSEPFSVIAETLVNVGVPAVVANQFSVPDSMVAAFVGALYAELLKTGDIDQAMSEGRVNLWSQPGPQNKASIEWGIPTLHRLVGASRLFEI
jgi:hypothetical protein